MTPAGTWFTDTLKFLKTQKVFDILGYALLMGGGSGLSSAAPKNRDISGSGTGFPVICISSRTAFLRPDPFCMGSW